MEGDEQPGYYRDTANVSLSYGTGGSTLALGVFRTGMALDHVEGKALFLAVKYLAIQVGAGVECIGVS
jgi:hypothetical protein